MDVGIWKQSSEKNVWTQEKGRHSRLKRYYLRSFITFYAFDRCYWNDQIVTDLVATFKVRDQIGNIGPAGRIG